MIFVGEEHQQWRRKSKCLHVGEEHQQGRRKATKAKN